MVVTARDEGVIVGSLIGSTVVCTPVIEVALGTVERFEAVGVTEVATVSSLVSEVEHSPNTKRKTTIR